MNIFDINLVLWEPALRRHASLHGRRNACTRIFTTLDNNKHHELFVADRYLLSKNVMYTAEALKFTILFIDKTVIVNL